MIQSSIQGGHTEFFEAEFQFSKEVSPKKKKRVRQKRVKTVEDDEEHFEFKPNISELLKQEMGFSDTEEGRQESDNDEDEQDEDTTEPDFNDYFDESEDEEEDEETNESPDIASKIKDSDEQKLEKIRKIEEKDVVKFEEDEVKMEPETESDDEEEFETENSQNSTSQLKKRLSDEDSGSEKVKKGEKTPKYVYKYKGENPPCEICGKLFSRPSDLIKHMVTHTGAREYKCDICQDNFPLLNSLTR